MIHLDYGNLNFPLFNLRNIPFINHGSSLIGEKLLKPKSFEITFPVILDMKDDELQKKLNNILKEFLCNFILSHITLMDEEKNFNSFKVSYQIPLNQNNLLSVLYKIVYSLDEENTNTLTNISSINFDTISGKIYSFKDLFITDCNYKDFIRDIIKNQIKEKYIELVGKYEEIEDCQNFYMTPSSLVIYYQASEYTAYGDYPIHFEIPYTDISNILNPTLFKSHKFSPKIHERINDQDDKIVIELLRNAIKLFMEAVEEINIDSAEKVAMIWAKGVKNRNGALQYSVLNDSLKAKMLKCLNNTSWITGSSTPWIEDYKLEDCLEIDKNTYKIIVKFSIISSEVDAGFVKATLILKKENTKWVICSIS